jgi:hypothetical protein
MASAFRRAAKNTTPSLPSRNSSGTANATEPVQPSDADSKSTTTPTTTTAVSSSLSGLRGVKPWTGGIHLTSVGLNDLDTILGGGQPLGTCILVQEDRISRDLAHSLVRYWCAEVCMGLPPHMSDQVLTARESYVLCFFYIGPH